MKKIISRFLALAMLITSCQFTAASANEPDAKVWGEPNFTENFANYTSDDIEYDSSNNYYRLGDGMKTVAANPSGAKWVTSNEWKSLNGDGKVFVNYQDGRMGINGCGSGWTSSVNLDMGDVRIDKIERLAFKTSTDNRAQGMMMFVSEDEKNWIMFGSRNGEGVDYTSQGNAPFVIKCVNGVRTLVDEDTQTWGGGYHGYNWDIQADGNTITWTVVEEGTDLTWTDSYTDTDGIISAEWKYPCAAYSIGDGWGYIYNAQMWYKEAKVWGEPNFTENFANYTSDDIEYDSSNNYYRLGDGVKTVAANPSGAKWVTSNEWKSLNGDGKVFINYQDGRMGINGCGSGWTSSVNLDMGDVRIDKIERLTFKTSTDNRAQGMMMFVSEDEKNWIMFGSRNGENVDYTSQGNAPFVIKCVNGTKSLVSEDTQTWGGGYHGYNWDIQADGNTITWTVVEEGTNLTWTDSYTDTDGIISAEWKYPCAAYSIGDGWGYIYNAQLWYTKAKYDKFTENFANYTSADITYNSDRNYWRLGDGAKALVTNPSGAKWVTSKVWTALNGDGKAFVSYDNGRIGINGCSSGYISSVNLDMGDVRAETIGELKFRTSTDNRAQGMMMFVSEDEKNWIMFGSRNGENVDYTSQGNAPFVIKCVNGTRSLVSEDTQTWGGGYHGYNWDIQVDGNKITWSVAEEGTNLVWTNSYTDTDGIISANWKYPCAAYSIGDGWGYVYSAEMLYTKKAEWNYEKKAYTKVELDALLEDAAYNSDDVHKLLGLDLNSVKQNTGSAAVTVGTDGINAGADLDGIECEFVDSYDLFFNEDGSLKEDYVAFAKSMPKIPSFRLGGTASAKVNFMNTIGALSDRKESTFITLPENTDWTVGEKSADVMKMGVVEYLKVIYANNPNASFIPCISMMTMTPEETANLVHFLTDDASTDWGAKRAALGIENPVNVKYVELTNECDQYTDSGRAWYTNLAKQHIEAINAANANVKVMACGPTAPWGNSEWKSWVEYIAENLGTQIDAISFHPYYYGHETGTLLEYIKEIKAIIDKKIPGNNIKISLTEHGRDWGLNKNGHTSNMLAAVMQSYFLQEVSKLDYLDGAYMNGFITTESDLWQYWINKNGEWYTSPLQKAMALVGGSMGAKTLDTTVNYTDNTGAWPEDLSSRSLEDLVNVTAQQVSDNEIKLIMSNIAAYTDVDLAFNLGEKYDIVKEEVLSSPNMDTYAYDKYSADLTTVSADETEKENFTSYKLPAMKVVVLTLKKSDGSKKLTEDFSSYGEVAEKSGEDADKLLVSNANGTKWSLSETKTGYAEIGLDEVYGAASITGGKLVMTSEGQEEEFAVNWNTADFAGLDNISRIKFTLANEAGVSAGVRLFVNSDETASVELTNAAAGFDGAVSVDWVCELGSGTLTWSATDGNTVKTGSVSYSDANYAYLMQVFTKAIGSENFAASIDDIEVKYGASQEEEFSVTYTQSDTQYTVTVNPGQYSSVWVAAAYYAEDGSLIKVCTKTITQNDTLNAAKPDKAYSSFKVFCWEMTNEIDMLGEENREYIQEYIDTVKAYAEEIRKVEPDAKIAACGPTAPWGHYWNVAEDSDQWWAWWHRQIMPQLADTVDAITFHPYYDGYSTEFMFYFMDTMKADCDKIVEEQGVKDKDGNPKDIKILSTEAARFWDPSDWFWGSSCHEAALSSSHFLNTAMKRDWFVGSSYHHLTGYNLWAYWGINNGEWYESPTAKLYRLYNDNLGDRIVGSSYEMLNDDYKELGEYDTVPFSLVASANGNNELTVILLNKEPYKDVNVEFEFKNDYTLVEESVFSSPNISTFAYDKTAEEMTKITTTQTDEKNFKSYHMKPATVVALKLKTNSKIPQKSGETAVESEPEADTGKSFSDIQNHWARNEIALMQENGMVSGVNNNEFAPDRTVTKAEFAAIASRVMGFDAEKYAGSAFADCSGAEWYAGFANAMKANGYIRGTVFDAAAGITVADLCRTAVLMYENGGVPEVDEIDVAGIENLTDIQKEYVKKAAKYGLINRLFENGKCDFSANATRAEATYVLYRVYSHNR